MRGLVVLVTLACFATAQHQALIDYLERRLLAIEDRISLWHEQTTRYASELRELKQQMVSQLENLDKEKEALRMNIDSVGTRVDRVERELDYLETQNGAQPCVDVDDKLIEQQVTVVKEKQKSKYSQLSDCSDMISSIKAMKILKRVGGQKGTWTKDTNRASGKVYIFNGTEDDIIHAFASVQDFTRSSGMSLSSTVKLPSAWRGTGHVVYNNYVYYMSQADELKVVKHDLQNNSLTDSAVFPVQDHVPVYGLTPETVIDLAVDEEGLWAIYATQQNERYISLAKMDTTSLDIEQMWDTNCPRENAEAAFVICGTLYVVYNTKQAGRSRVQCVFDVNDMVTSEDAPLVYFPKRYGSHSSLKYNPHEKLLYAWDDGYQILYKLTMKKKLEI
ncbi:olfactomedin-like protein 3A [Maylandia zebra]|uniref:Olfactomedin like 3 n=4 Tax=Haplochromini TaxID=319058 RepID=A0A3B4GYG7_9CICH|nr:olfactomedin-like protein 3 [Maylandia zebra]XP_005739581.1 PREDICTED: olfactomedin-like protein 3 [Pundamilia nyererei]XP_005924848.1 olfactomedin-like protein 3A [Haplochromis burtoni]XP_026023989.1 olfactomedin-like protein 3 [Astatotilapia calliptera]